MLTILFRFLAILSALWFVQRFIGLLLGKKAGRPDRQPPASIPGNTVKDPVCGMYMDPRLAIRLQRKDGDVFFCSKECQQKFLAHPG